MLESSGSYEFDTLRAGLLDDARLRRELEWALDLIVTNYNPSNRGNRFTCGALVEGALALVALNVGIVTLPGGHNVNGADLMSLRERTSELWGVKSSFQDRLSSSIIMSNGMGGAGRGFSTPTVFLSPVLGGLVYADPALHRELVLATRGAGGEARLPLGKIVSHAKRHPACHVLLEVPVNRRGPDQDQYMALLEALLTPAQFPTLAQPFRRAEAARSNNAIAQLREIVAMREAGEITPSQADGLISDLTWASSASK